MHIIFCFCIYFFLSGTRADIIIYVQGPGTICNYVENPLRKHGLHTSSTWQQRSLFLYSAACTSSSSFLRRQLVRHPARALQSLPLRGCEYRLDAVLVAAARRHKVQASAARPALLRGDEPRPLG